MNLVCLDFETFFSDTFTLKKLTTEEYIRSPEFETLLCGFRWQDGRREWVGQEDLPTYLPAIDWADTAVLGHHMHFDGLILSHHYGIKPRFIYDTLSMGRLVHGNHISVSLESLCRLYGLAAKSIDYDSFKGKRFSGLSNVELRNLGSGCLGDVDRTLEIFGKMAINFPREEYQVIDSTVRMFIEPQLVGDVQTFGKVWTYEAERKAALLQRLGEDLGVLPEALPTLLQSSPKFAELLVAEGIEPAKKPGKPNKDGSEKLIYAFAKTDNFMQELLEHDSDKVRTLAEARLGLKSTLDQTRAERLGFMAQRGAMSVYLNYCGAHTTRWSGGDGLNYQNFKRGSLLRAGHHAPRGHTIVKADKSQIECRILCYVAGQWDVIELFKNGEDPYIGIASDFYGRPITRADVAERGLGKQIRLSCGFQCGAESIVRTARRGTYGPPVHLTQQEGLAARDLYRGTHPGVVDYWKQAGRMIAAVAGTDAPIAWGPLTVSTGVIHLPNGCPLWYPELNFHRDEEGEEYWRYKTRKGWAKLYGGKLVENVVQAMSRVDMSQSLLRILSRTNIRPAQLEHDAAVWVVPNNLVDAFVKVVNDEMTRAPTWLPGIPLSCEVSTGETM